MRQTEKDLEKLQKLECDRCLPDIERYYDDMADITDHNYLLMAKDDEHRHKGSKALLQLGRVVVLSDGVSAIAASPVRGMC